MSSRQKRVCNRRRAGLRIAGLALASVPILGRIGRADTSNGVSLIQEDWRLVIGTPDTINHAPGVKMIMSTQSDLLGYSADYSINFHKEGTPAVFAPGGFGIELCSPNGDAPVSAGGPTSTLLSNAGETLSWTQQLDLSGGMLTFSLWNGNSTTWGSNPGEILSVSTSCSLSNLSRYTPQVSIAQSGPVWWPGRVTSLTFTGVRYYDDAGNLLLASTIQVRAYP